MFGSVCMCVHVWIYVCTYVDLCVCKDIHGPMYVHVWVYGYVYMCGSVRICVYTCAVCVYMCGVSVCTYVSCVCVSVSVCMHLGLCVCVYMCGSLCVHM